MFSAESKDQHIEVAPSAFRGPVTTPYPAALCPCLPPPPLRIPSNALVMLTALGQTPVNLTCLTLLSRAFTPLVSPASESQRSPANQIQPADGHLSALCPHQSQPAGSPLLWCLWGEITGIYLSLVPPACGAFPDECSCRLVDDGMADGSRLRVAPPPNSGMNTYEWAMVVSHQLMS